mgnify:FL=1
MGHRGHLGMQEQLQARRLAWIETFRSRSRWDLKPGWHRAGDRDRLSLLHDDWAQIHRPDWVARGLLVWPRGGVWLQLQQEILCPEDWRQAQASCLRLVLGWWADQMRLWVDGVLVHEGDLFDTTCRWSLPESIRWERPLTLLLELRSPSHDDGALINSELVLEPRAGAVDLDQVLLPEALALYLEVGEVLPEAWLELDPHSQEATVAVDQQLRNAARPPGLIHWIGHAHLDLAWLWSVADTWQAAERTFRSVLHLMQRFPDFHFSHSSPALYQWVEHHRPTLFAALQDASRAGRWEPINGPWVETDCVLVSTASLWRQFTLGQQYSRSAFPEWSHQLAWLPDSFGFAAGLPAVATQTGIRWFCTHKLAWNASNPFPHRLFRWCSRGQAEVLALMLPPIGTDGNPMAMLREQRSWQASTAVEEALWVPGVGDHGGGPTAEMLEQLQLWEDHPQALPQRPGTIRSYLATLEAHIETLPVWRDELYLELHRGCATTRPDQKRQNRHLERLLREADLAIALLACHLGDRTDVPGTSASSLPDWRPLLFQQFHDILPGTSIPEVFEQAEPVWRSSCRESRRSRDQHLQQLLRSGVSCSDRFDPESSGGCWVWMGLQPLQRWSPVLRLPRDQWGSAGRKLPCQEAKGGGTWVQLPVQQGVTAVPLQRCVSKALEVVDGLPVRGAVQIQPLDQGGWRIGNGLLEADFGAEGLQQLWDRNGTPQLAGPLIWGRFRDRGEFWDAWDLAADYRQHPLALNWNGSMELVERGPLVARLVLRGWAGSSALRLDVQLRADCPWLELRLGVDWRQSHELLRLEVPLACSAVRWAADTSGGVIERPAEAMTAREKERWEVPVISWLASESAAPGGGLAVLLDGPQGVQVCPDRLGVSLLRGATWPDPSADRGWHRQRLALMPVPDGWSREAVPQAALAFREPGWLGPSDLKVAWSGLPSLPSKLVPLAVTYAEVRRLKLSVLNAGATRQSWAVGKTWRVGSAHESCLGEAVELKPGELAELLLERVD